MIVDFAGIKVDNVTMAEALAKIESFLNGAQPQLIVTPNPEIIVAAQNDDELKTIVNSAALRLPDGISMVIVSKLLRTPLKQRVTGIDLMLKLIEAAAVKGRKIHLLGGAPGVADEAAAKLKQQYPTLNIVGAENGYFSADVEVIKKIKATKPDMLFVGLGAGKQEKWLARHLKELNVPASMVIGGSLDVISGRKNRAPKWIQALYLEWLYRLFTEPNRWKRQLALPKFLYLTLFKKML
ncbi:MAG: WecB/TagA/CpsF family glycosyltransferase [Candidatus Margulisbacteria bacterium]|nr:WecB/TagA/CpsF family glycosyltransferase [Candidatus Margulisiibacteriota bacterium]